MMFPVVEVPPIAARFSPFHIGFYFIPEHAIVVIGALAGTALGVWAWRSRKAPLAHAWGLAIACFGMSVGLLLAYWGQAFPEECFDSGFRLGVVRLNPTGGCPLWSPELDQADFFLLLGFTMVLGGGLALVTLLRSVLASGTSGTPTPPVGALVTASVFSLAWLAVEANENRYNAMALVPPLTYFWLATVAHRRSLVAQASVETAPQAAARPAPVSSAPAGSRPATGAGGVPLAVGLRGAPAPAAASDRPVAVLDGAGERPLTEHERDRLKGAGSRGKEITWLLGVGSLSMSVFAFIGMSQGDELKNPWVLYIVLLVLNLAGFAVGTANRQLRTLAAAGLAKGTLREAPATPRALGGQTKGFDLGGAQLVPLSLLPNNPAHYLPNSSYPALAGAMASVDKIRVSYAGPFGDKSPQALLMEIDGTSLPAPVPCQWAPSK